MFLFCSHCDIIFDARYIPASNIILFHISIEEVSLSVTKIPGKIPGAIEEQAPLKQPESTDEKLQETQSVKHSNKETTENKILMITESIPQTDINAGNINALKFISI